MNIFAVTRNIIFDEIYDLEIFSLMPDELSSTISNHYLVTACIDESIDIWAVWKDLRISPKSEHVEKFMNNYYNFNQAPFIASCLNDILQMHRESPNHHYAFKIACKALLLTFGYGYDSGDAMMMTRFKLNWLLKTKTNYANIIPDFHNYLFNKRPWESPDAQGAIGNLSDYK